MKIRSLFSNACATLILGAALLTGFGCTDTEKKGSTTGKVVLTEVTSCSELDGKEDACETAKQKSDSKRCVYDAGKCVVFIPGGKQLFTGKCEELDTTKCVFRYDCAVVNGACADAAGDCGNVKDETACKTTYGSSSNAKCEWSGGVCKKAATLTKNVRSYELAKIGKAAADPANYGAINDDNLAGVSASLDGNFVYIVGTAAATLLAREVGNPADPWANVSAAWNNLTSAADASGTLAFNGKAVVKFAPLSDGLLFSTTADRVLAQVKGKGGNGAGIQGWAKNVAGLKNEDEAPQALASVKKANGDEVIYLNHHDPANSTMFADKKLIPVGVNAADGISNAAFAGGQLVFDPTLANSKKYKQIFQDQDGNLLMVSNDGLAVDKLNAASIGVTLQDLTNPAHGVVDYFKADAGAALSRVALHNNPIKECATVDKYIVCGTTLANPLQDGGIAVYDTTSGAAIAAPGSWRWLNDGATVAHNFVSIVVDRHDVDKKDKRALVFVKTGFYIFEDGDFVTSFEGAASKLIDNRVSGITSDVVDFNSARSGFAPTSTANLPLPAGGNFTYLGGGQDSTGRFWIGIKGHGNNDGGVFTLTIRDAQFAK